MSRLQVLCVLGLLVACVFAQAGRYNIGRKATPEEVRTLDISVRPDGLGLPSGHGTPDEGRRVYAAKCSSCHGDRGEGAAHYPALVGGQGSLTSGAHVIEMEEGERAFFFVLFLRHVMP